MSIGQLRLLPLYSLSIILALQMSSSMAADCGAIQYNKAKSRNVSISQNECLDNIIGIGTQVALLPSARLWLQESKSNQQDSYVHLICQNKSLSTIKLAIVKFNAPWIDVKGRQNCKAWNNNKLICTDTKKKSGSLFCVLKTLKNRLTLDTQEIERTTSVTMRSLRPNLVEPSQEVINMTLIAIGEEVDICRTIHNDTRAVSTSWFINANSTVKNVNIILEGTKSSDNLLTDCIESVVTAFPYPGSLQNIGMAYRY